MYVVFRIKNVDQLQELLDCVPVFLHAQEDSSSDEFVVEVGALQLVKVVAYVVEIVVLEEVSQDSLEFKDQFLIGQSCIPNVPHMVLQWLH